MTLAVDRLLNTNNQSIFFFSIARVRWNRRCREWNSGNEKPRPATNMPSSPRRNPGTVAIATLYFCLWSVKATQISWPVASKDLQNLNFDLSPLSMFKSDFYSIVFDFGFKYSEIWVKSYNLIHTGRGYKTFYQSHTLTQAIWSANQHAWVRVWNLNTIL